MKWFSLWYRWEFCTKVLDIHQELAVGEKNETYERLILICDTRRMENGWIGLFLIWDPRLMPVPTVTGCQILERCRHCGSSHVSMLRTCSTACFIHTHVCSVFSVYTEGDVTCVHPYNMNARNLCARNLYARTRCSLYVLLRSPLLVELRSSAWCFFLVNKHNNEFKNSIKSK